MKRIWPFLTVLVVLPLLPGCMSFFNLSLEEGVYVAGDWNSWLPSERDAMVPKDGIYTFNLPVSSITFTTASKGHIGWYKVIYVGADGSKVQSGVPVWEELLGEATTITVYASPDLMHDGYAVGAGDSEKSMGSWYCAGEFNSWSPSPMTFDGSVFRYEVEITDGVKAGDTFAYKIARGTDWKPYEEQFDGKNYNAGYGQDAHFTATKDGTVVVVEYDPKLSVLRAYVK